MREGSPVGTEVFVQGVLDESVDERIATGGIGWFTHQGHGGGGFEDVEQLVVGSPGCSGQEIEIEIPTDDGRHRQHPPGVCSESSDPRPDHLTQAVGQSHLLQGVLGRPASGSVLVNGAGLGKVSKNFVHEEGVAVGLSIDGMSETHPGIIKRVPGGGLQE